MAKKSVVQEELKNFKGTKTGKAMNWIADAARKRSPGNGAGSRLIKDDDEKPADRPGARKDERPRKDVNLIDEKSGQNVGKLPYGVKSKDPGKQRYADDVKKRNIAREKGGFYKNRKPTVKGQDEMQEESSRAIFGGDVDDPRWDEHKKRAKR